MATQKSMMSKFDWDPRYRVSRMEDVMTPALVVYPEIIASNIGSLARAHQDGQAGLHSADDGRARHPQF
jgi:hypothetical protein